MDVYKLRQIGSTAGLSVVKLLWIESCLSELCPCSKFPSPLPTTYSEQFLDKGSWYMLPSKN